MWHAVGQVLAVESWPSTAGQGRAAAHQFARPGSTRAGAAPKERIAHLKKALENCARAIVDIRVHAQGASREEIAVFVRDEGLQDAQLGENLWQRTLTSSPQIVTYHLGSRRFEALYRDARRKQGAHFSLRAFTDSMMSLGPVPLREYGAQ